MNLTRKEKLELLELWNGHYNNFSQTWEKLLEVFGGNKDSDLFSNTFRMFDAYTDAVEKLFGDDDCWLSWWIYDCNQGKKYPYIKIGSKKMKCKSLEDLLKIIEATTNKTK